MTASPKKTFLDALDTKQKVRDQVLQSRIAIGEEVDIGAQAIYFF